MLHQVLQENREIQQKQLGRRWGKSSANHSHLPLVSTTALRGLRTTGLRYPVTSRPLRWFVPNSFTAAAQLPSANSSHCSSHREPQAGGFGREQAQSTGICANQDPDLTCKPVCGPTSQPVSSEAVQLTSYFLTGRPRTFPCHSHAWVYAATKKNLFYRSQGPHNRDHPTPKSAASVLVNTECMSKT